jgi:hypothetical protein
VKITMLEDAPGSPDGIHVQDYEAGVEYDVPDRSATRSSSTGTPSPPASPPSRRPSRRPGQGRRRAPENKAG